MDMERIVFRLLALMPALTFHEFAHAWSAVRMGDPTPRLQGRVSLNPLAHLDPMGTLMILFAPIGWAKPVQVNPYNFAHPERDFMISTACGPLANLIQGTVVGLLVRALLMSGQDMNIMLINYLRFVTLINFCLAVFNLVPLGPLDGHRILAYFLPYAAKARYQAFNSRYGMMALFGIIIMSSMGGVDLLGWWLRPAFFMVRLTTGMGI